VLWKSLLIGFICGTAVSIGNYYYLQWTMKKNKDRSSKEAINAVISCYINRFFINFLTLFLVFFFGREVWMLAGAGLGLVVMKNVYIVNEYRDSKKHPWKKRKSP
jgi:energy-converting hydrogenase Eha subunit G